MSRMSSAEYAEFHESRESICAPCHTRHRCPALPQRVRCVECKTPLDHDEVNDDGLCGDCEKKQALADAAEFYTALCAKSDGASK